MPDERLDSMRQGIAAPPESPEATQADAERRAEIARNPSPVEMEGAMGGSSDADRPADEAALDAVRHAGLEEGEASEEGGQQRSDSLDDQAQTLRETREAGLRAQGGGSSDEDEIERSAATEGR
jgi:hypothetical protein